MASVNPIRVEIIKYDGSPHRGYPASLLGRDEHGSWLGVASGTVSDDGVAHELPWVLLIPDSGWWTAMFNPPPQGSEVYCDIATPATWTTRGVTVADLDLDVKRRRASGAVLLVDEDEFAVHRVRFDYPPMVVEQAWAAAKYLERALADGTEPFATHYLRWLEKVTT